MVHNDKFNQLNINVLQMVRLKKHMKTKLVREKLFNVLYYLFFIKFVALTNAHIDPSSFLGQWGRRIKVTCGDGNCLFRNIAMVMCGNEEHHQFVRRTLATFCSHNNKLFQQFCHPIKDHIIGMMLDRIWGTDLEIHAAALLWQVDVYVCQPNTSDSSYSWICFKLFPQSQLIYPEESPQIPRPPGVLHFELLYASRCDCWATWIHSELPTKDDRPEWSTHIFIIGINVVH